MLSPSFAGRRPEIEFEPSSGIVPPNSSVELQATFSPHQERSLNYNVVCTIKKKSTKLTLNIKGDGCAIHETLQIERNDGGVVTLSPQGASNSVDFGQVIVNERAVTAVVLVNSGEQQGGLLTVCLPLSSGFRGMLGSLSLTRCPSMSAL